MTQPTRDERQGGDEEHVKAEHGARSEVNWDGGRGSEPYSNQPGAQPEEPQGGDEFSEGDRGELSGRNLEQLEAVRTKP